MIGKSRQGHIAGSAVGTFGEHNAQDFRRGDGIIAECFVEIPHAKKDNGIAVLPLHLLVLAHEGRTLGLRFITHRLSLFKRTFPSRSVQPCLSQYSRTGMANFRVKPVMCLKSATFISVWV